MPRRKGQKSYRAAFSLRELPALEPGGRLSSQPASRVTGTVPAVRLTWMQTSHGTEYHPGMIPSGQCPSRSCC